MITFLKGQLVQKMPPTLVLEVNGVGYELEASMHTFYQLPEADNTVQLYTHPIIREDAHLLFGFYEHNERELFRILIKTNGVGPRSAITILSSLGVDELTQCVHQDDVNQLVKVPGIGKKTAERLLLDLRDQLKSWSSSAHASAPNVTAQQPGSDQQLEAGQTDRRQDAINALIALGYKPNNASQAINKIYRQQPDAETEYLIKQGLQQLN